LQYKPLIDSRHRDPGFLNPPISSSEAFISLHYSGVTTTDNHLQGSSILSTLTAHPSFTQIHAYTRSELPISEKLKPISNSDTSTWASSYPKDTPILFSGLGTTRAAAGGLENQRRVDHDLNLDIVTATLSTATLTR